MLRLFAAMILNPRFVLVFLCVFVVSFSNAMLVPILPKVIAELSGYSIGKASIVGGWLMFAYALMQFCFAPLLGHLSDVFGRKRILQVSLLSLCLDYLLQGFATSLLMLFLGRVIAGFWGANYATATAYLADISSNNKRSQNFALIGAAFGLGFLLGPMCGAATLVWGTRAPFFLSAACSMLGFVVVALFLNESLPPAKRIHFDKNKLNPLSVLTFINNHPHVRGLLLGIALIYVVTYAILSNWPYYSMYVFGWHEMQIGYSMAYTGMFIVVSQAFIIRVLLNYLSQKHVIYVSMLTYFLAVMLFAINKSDQNIMWILLLFSLGGMAIPAIQGAVSASIDSQSQGELQGAITALLSAGSIIGPVLINYVFDIFTSQAIAYTYSGAGFVLCAIIISIAFIATVLNLSKQ
jgi:DHA1 family tetracycline resistance protein-like MFS transporter